MWHVTKLRQNLCLRAFSIVIYGKCNFNLLVFFSFFVWSVNYKSLTCKLWILFWTFRGMWTVLKCYRIFGTILYRKINSNRQPLFSYFLSQFGTVCYVCQICKLKLLFWTIFILIGSIFCWTHFITAIQPLYSELYFSILSGDCGNFLFYPETSNLHNSEIVGRRKLPDPSLNIDHF